MKLSVAMITYNHSRFIAQAIDSVLAQKVNFDYEIVVGEDNSTDGTRDIILDFHRRYPNRIVPLLRDRNLGAMRNFKETLTACRGEYVALLEGDDYWTHDRKLQTQIDFLDSEKEYAICCARAELLDETGRARAKIHPTIPCGSYTVLDLFETNWVVTCTAIYRWGAIAAFPDWILSLKMGDWPLHILVARSGKIRLMDEVLGVYRLHPAGAWSSLSQAEQLLATRQMLTVLDEHLHFQYTDQIRRTLARLDLDLAVIARAGGSGSRAETAARVLSCLRNGGLRLPGSQRLLAGLGAFALIGSWYKIFSISKKVARSDGPPSN